MKKKFFIKNDELNIIDFFKIILNGKKYVLIFTIISFLIGFGYSYQLPKNYLHTITLKPADQSEFVKLKFINLFLGNNLNTKRIANDNIKRFIYELQDYEEFITILKDNKKVEKRISNLDIDDQKKKLFKYTKLFKIKEPDKRQSDYIISLKWNDPEEGIDILQNTLDFTLDNFEKRIYKELEDNLKMKKKTFLNKDLEKLDFLLKQSSIAKELKIADTQVENAELYQSDIKFNIDNADIAYYLRGYRAIDKEIELIKNQKYKSLDFIENEINFLKKENISWVDYNFYLIEVKSLNNFKLIILTSILIGLIIGVLFVLILNVFQTQIYPSKKIK